MSNISRNDLILQVEELRGVIEEKNVKVNSCIKKCYKIERKLLEEKISTNGLLKIQYEIIQLKRKVNDTDGKNGKKLIQMMLTLIMLFGLIVLGLEHNKSEILFPGFAEFILFITLGAIGAITYILVEIYNNTGDIEYRMMLAILFPVVFISVFNYNSDGITGFQGINFLFFVCGFSTNVFLLLLNKMVNTAKDAFGIKNPEYSEKTE